MVNDVGTIGSSVTQSLGYPASAPVSGGESRYALPAIEQETSPTLPARDKIEVTQGGFAALENNKQTASTDAATARAVGEALNKVGDLLGKAQQQVQMVKNYPPYPPGSEDRAQYIKGIDGLRKEIEAVTVPPINDQYKPVFYPQEPKFPELDPQTATNDQIASFGQAVTAAQSRLNAGFADLQVQVDQVAHKINAEIPQPAHAEDAGQLAELVSRQLNGSRYSIVSNTGLTAQLG